MDQTPMPGELIKENTVIHLTLAKDMVEENDETVTVPNVMDMTVQQANEASRSSRIKNLP